jgi:hypothetical protein
MSGLGQASIVVPDDVELVAVGDPVVVSDVP